MGGLGESSCLNGLQLDLFVFGKERNQTSIEETVLWQESLWAAGAPYTLKVRPMREKESARRRMALHT
ncbi:hypothetical protein MHYP_G00353460 [Metynnis hypsauchen]